MKILKTSALAAVLALGSLSANAAYDGNDKFDLRLATANAIAVSFTDASTIAFENLIPGDSISDTVAVSITGTNANTMTCTLSVDGATAITLASGVASTHDIKYDGADGVAGNSDDKLLISGASFTIDACSTSASTLTIAGQVNSEAPINVSQTEEMTLVVSYGTGSLTGLTGTKT